jgi:aspartyl/asparaginyl beta-hydroxylase (cupin superfamily)
VSTVAAAAAGGAANPRRPLAVRLGKKARWGINRIVSRYSRVPLTPVVGTEHFPWLREIERAAPVIRAEADYLLRHIAAIPPMNQMSPDHQRIAGAGGWRSFFLVGYGYRIEANCARCPQTIAALEQVPGLVTALFSILEPGMHVARHRGVFRGIMIAHLGLYVPRDSALCRMDVDGEIVQWEERRTFVFDDTYPHEVWNDTNERRVILLIQFRRPMRLVGRLLTKLLISAVRHSPYIQDARLNVDHWERAFAASERGRARDP